MNSELIVETWIGDKDASSCFPCDSRFQNLKDRAKTCKRILKISYNEIQEHRVSAMKPLHDATKARRIQKRVCRTFSPSKIKQIN